MQVWVARGVAAPRDGDRWHTSIDRPAVARGSRRSGVLGAGTDGDVGPRRHGPGSAEPRGTRGGHAHLPAVDLPPPGGPLPVDAGDPRRVPPPGRRFRRRRVRPRRSPSRDRIGSGSDPPCRCPGADLRHRAPPPPPGGRRSGQRGHRPAPRPGPDLGNGPPVRRRGTPDREPGDRLGRQPHHRSAGSPAPPLGGRSSARRSPTEVRPRHRSTSDGGGTHL
ncbi:MAG: hypothetical protein KatS3mg011_2081 [Acidimicrobiia bacterium]|nr:MAG: hypothetical protein KatS3mg011_2081 [Acidimicrobiia bacterium]